jgi:hypothetical protein
VSNVPWEQGLSPNLIPNPPGAIPEAPEVGDALKNLSPFTEAIDVDAIIANLILDRPLKLFIPNRERYPEFQFRIINSIPQEIAAAHNKGYREVTDPELSKLFDHLVAGTDKTGKQYRPILMARPTAVAQHIQRRHRGALKSIYAGMDPKNKEFNSQYAERVDDKSLTYGKFTGDGWRIRV